MLTPQERAEREQRIAALACAGESTPRIAALEGVTTRTVQRARRRMGVAGKRCHNPLTPADLHMAAVLLDDGASYREVARTLRRSDMAIRNHFHGLSQWPQSSGSEFRKLRAGLEAIPVHGYCATRVAW